MCHPDPNLPPAETTELLIDAVVELITNAVKAMMPAGGMMRIATFKTSKDKISIQVTDNGPGIARDKLDKVFDMFYTTSPHGLGFGLWWVKTFLEQQNGDITVESRPNQGATFTITLPRHLSSLQSSEK
jgi:signal transduction histidine kinase